MRPLAFAWISLVRQPARAALGILGIAAVGALLFDMLLLSRGLVVSFGELLDEVGFDVRVAAVESMPRAGPRVTDATATAAGLAALPEVAAAVPVQIGSAEVDDPALPEISLVGSADASESPWQVLEGPGLQAERPDGRAQVLVNRNMARRLALTPGALIGLRGTCEADSAPPRVEVEVAGIADFYFDDASQLTAAMRLEDFRRTCGIEGDDTADLILVAADPDLGPTAAVEAIERARSDLHAFSNEQLIARFQQVEFSYFRQISAVLATITLFFGFLLITVLLTVSVNQRLGEIAALRALGLTRRRVVTDVVLESALLVGLGGALALPLGLGLAIWLDTILRAMPGIPANLHFFVFEPRALVLHAGLLAATALAAALYPARLVARLPISATLRNEGAT